MFLKISLLQKKRKKRKNELTVSQKNRKSLEKCLGLFQKIDQKDKG